MILFMLLIFGCSVIEVEDTDVAQDLPFADRDCTDGAVMHYNGDRYDCIDGQWVDHYFVEDNY